MTKEFYSNGKLLISGEYAILDGAQAMAIPTTYGQSLKVTTNSTKNILWKSYNENNELWFEAKLASKTLQIITSSDTNIASTLVTILQKAQELNHTFLAAHEGYAISTLLNFPKDWGLGTSSTLINNIANWANINPYKLLSLTFGGSGYDIACAQYNRPILYQLVNNTPIINEVALSLPFSADLYFVYLNKKMNSRDAIAAYRARKIDKKILASSISEITLKFIEATSLESFMALVDQHEVLLSEALDIPTIKSQHFADFSGSIKSLGGWGGDFVLAVAEVDPASYFKAKGYQTVIPFDDMILKKP